MKKSMKKRAKKMMAAKKGGKTDAMPKKGAKGAMMKRLAGQEM